MSATLTIRVEPEGEKARCRVAFEHERESLALENLVEPPFDANDLRDARWYFEEFPVLRGDTPALRAAQIESRLRAKGSQLYAALLEQSSDAPGIAERLSTEGILGILAVRIVEANDAPWIPWEFMTGPALTPLSHRAASFVRVVPGAEAAVETAESPGLRILVVTARPLSTEGGEDVPFRSVSRHIVLAAATNPEAGLSVDLVRPPTFDAFASLLRAAKAAGRPYDLVHFDGHGEYRASPFAPNRKRGYLLFERETGSVPDPIDGARFGGLLMETGVRAALLNACRSAYVEVGVGSAMGSFAEEAASCGLPGVVAMGFNVTVEAAARLFASIYSALASGSSLGEAVSDARRSLTDRPGVRDLTWPGILDCALPIVYERERLCLAPYGTPVPFEIDPTRATPPSGAVTELGPQNQARSGDRPYVGYDDAILDIERAFRHGAVAEVVGVAGVGKSALAAEFARWSVLTRAGSRAVVTDLAAYDGADSLREALAPWADALWVLEGADRIAWGDDLQTLLRGRKTRLTLLTGRASCLFQGVTTLPLLGLDAVDRRRFAQVATPGLVEKKGFAAFLEWSQGVPGVVTAAASLMTEEQLDDYEAAHATLQSLREGAPEALDLAQAMGLEPFDPAGPIDTRMALMVYLFQGFLAWHDWKTVAALYSPRGVDFGLKEPADLTSCLRSAARQGLACPVDDRWHALHPLAPVIAAKPFYDLVMAMGGTEMERRREAVRFAWTKVLQAVGVSLRMARTLPENVEGFASVRRQSQNLWVLAEAGSRGGGIALLSLPLLSTLRDTLLAEGRDGEWRSFLNRTLNGLEKDPPPEDAGPESPRLLVNALLSAEAERSGEFQIGQDLREDSLQYAASRTVTVAPVDAANGPVIDLSRFQRIATLLQEGEALIRKGSPEGLTILKQAEEWAKDDPFREGKVKLAIARAYLNVPSLRDLGQYETYARTALALTPAIDKAQEAQARQSVGTAIATRLAEEPHPTDAKARAAEAETLLGLVTISPAADLHLKASATNSLGILKFAMEDYPAGAAAMLKASSMFDENGDRAESTVALTGAARALYQGGEIAQARQFATLASERDDVPPPLRELLTVILGSKG